MEEGKMLLVIMSCDVSDPSISLYLLVMQSNSSYKESCAKKTYVNAGSIKACLTNERKLISAVNELRKKRTWLAS
jgi:hypothetical protein